MLAWLKVAGGRFYGIKNDRICGMKMKIVLKSGWERLGGGGCVKAQGCLNLK